MSASRRKSYVDAITVGDESSDSEPYVPPLIMPDEEVIAMFVVPSTTAVAERTITTIETQEKNKLPEDFQPNRNSVTFFTAMDEEYLGLICYPSGEVSAVVPTANGKLTSNDFPPELDYQIAKSLVNESVTGVDKSTLPCVQFQKCAILNGELIPECARSLDENKLFDKRKNAKLATYPLTCYCYEPLVKGYSSKDKDLKDVVKCTNCKDQYHTRCLEDRNKLPDKKRTYKCPPCSTKTSGSIWGAGEVVSTCTLDNFTTGITLHTEQYGDGFIQSLQGTKEKEVMREVAKLAAIGDSAGAQQSWYNEVVLEMQFQEVEKVRTSNEEVTKRNKLARKTGQRVEKLKSYPKLSVSSLHGSTSVMTYGPIIDAFTFAASGTCNNQKCPKKIIKSEVKGFNLIHAKQLKDFPTYNEKCDHCKHGQRTMEVKNPESDESTVGNLVPPCMAHFDLEGAKPEDTKIFTDPNRTPNEITIDGYKFMKQMITFHNTDCKSGHFVSAQLYKGDWVWYDGISTPGLPRTHKRIRKITPDGKN